MRIWLVGVPETSTQPELQQTLVDRVNGGGNRVRIFPEDSVDILTGRISCDCELSGSLAEGKGDQVAGQVTEIVKNHFEAILKRSVQLEIFFSFNEPRQKSHSLAHIFRIKGAASSEPLFSFTKFVRDACYQTCAFTTVLYRLFPP